MYSESKDLTTAQVRELIDANLEEAYQRIRPRGYLRRRRVRNAFGRALKESPQLRDKIILQTKGGIVKDLSCHRYDNSANYLIDCVHKSLKKTRRGKGG